MILNRNELCCKIGRERECPFATYNKCYHCTLTHDSYTLAHNYYYCRETTQSSLRNEQIRRCETHTPNNKKRQREREQEKDDFRLYNNQFISTHSFKTRFNEVCMSFLYVNASLYPSACVCVCVFVSTK